MITTVVLLLGLISDTGKEVIVDRFDDRVSCQASIEHRSKDLPQVVDYKCVYFSRSEVAPNEVELDYGRGGP